MEKQSRTHALKAHLSDPAIWTGLFAAIYLAVLPMADTIALRNVALLALLVCLAWQFPKMRSEFRLGLPILLWAAYLLIFPVIADEHRVALQSLESQWGRGLLAMLAGAGTALVLRNRKWGGVFHLGLISSVSILVYLVLAAVKAWELHAIPWGYWGRETHHADLGYTAGQAAVLLTAVLVTQGKKYRFWSIALIAGGLVCTALARSRAGFVFALLGGVLVFATAYLAQGARHRRYALGSLVILILAGGVVFSIAAKVDPRWGNMATQLSAGFMGDAIQIECEGTASIEGDILARYGDGEQAQGIIYSVRIADGARMVLLRAGLALSLKHPWGLDGSRQSFQKLLRRECPAPVLNMAHAHNGWIDTALAIGWLGVVLYLAVLLQYAAQGYKRLRTEAEPNVWAVVLLTLSSFWMLRAMADSVFRDHMFEMQGFVLTYALLAMRNRTTEQMD